MSQEINNRKHRQEILKDLIMQLHDGKSLEELSLFLKNILNMFLLQRFLRWNRI